MVTVAQARRWQLHHPVVGAIVIKVSHDELFPQKLGIAREPCHSRLPCRGMPRAAFVSNAPVVTTEGGKAL